MFMKFIYTNLIPVTLPTVPYLKTGPLPNVDGINISFNVDLECPDICTVHVVPETHAQVL